MSFRRAVEHLQARYMLDLGHAKFAIKDAKLVSAAGSCLACPKRTGNQPEIYQDVDADVCTDPDCFESKVKAHNERKLTSAQKSGLPIYEPTDSYQSMQKNNQVSASDGLYKFERVVRGTVSTSKSIEDALTSDQLPKPVAFTKTHDGAVNPVYEKTAIQEALEKAGLCLTLEKHNALLQEKMSGDARAPKVSDKEKQERAATREREKKAALESTVRQRIFTQICADILLGKGHVSALREATKIVSQDWCFPSCLKGEYTFNPNDPKALSTYLDGATFEQTLVVLLSFALGIDLELHEHQLRDDDYLQEPTYKAILQVAEACSIDHATIRTEIMLPSQAEQTTENQTPDSEKTTTARKAPVSKKVQPKTAETVADAPKDAKTTKDATPAKKAAPAKPTPAKKAATTKAKVKEVSAVAWPFPTSAEMAARSK